MNKNPLERCRWEFFKGNDYHAALVFVGNTPNPETRYPQTAEAAIARYLKAFPDEVSLNLRAVRVQ